MNHDKVKNLSDQPGCYLFKDSQDKIIYVGKAKNLKKRVSSYFQKKDHDPKTAELIRHIDDLEFIVTDTELEALLLESKLIKIHRPKFNIDLKDNVRYPYLKITGEKFPRLMTVRQVEKDGGRYFGPYQDGAARETAARLARQIFKIRTCGDKLPKQACLQYYIKRCDAPCINNISEEQYGENVKRAGLFLKGNTGGLIRILNNEMSVFSARQDYEKAKERRDQASALGRMKQTQKVMLIKSFDEDLIDHVRFGDQVIIQLFHVQKGNVTDKLEFRFYNEPEILENFLRQYYANNRIPDQVIVAAEPKEKDLLEKYLTKLKSKPVRIIVAKRGNQLKLLHLVRNNILMSVRQESPALIELKEALFLDAIPQVIECFDISNIQDKWLVGSMVQFRGGQPDKNNYRRFKIRSVVGQDDFASMAEVVKRRYQHLREEQLPMPDLIVIDGGMGQLSSAFGQLRELDLNIPIISLAKREEEIYAPNSSRPLRLSRKSEALKLLQRVRNEAHRFAVTYHRLVRSKAEIGHNN